MTPPARFHSRSRLRRTFAAWIVIFGAALVTSFASSTSLSKPALLHLRFQQKLGASVPPDLRFVDDHGGSLSLRKYFGHRPTILVLGYYECPMLCSLVLNGLVESLQDIRADPGEAFEIIFVSIDPRETPLLAAAKKRTCLKRYGRTHTERGWHFLTGEYGEIEQLAQAVGFSYAYDATLNQYAHPSGIVILTPDGQVTKYFMGVSYPAAELNRAIQQASAHRVGSPVRDILILCFQHMPLVGEHSATIMGMVQASAAITIAGILAYIAVALVSERRKSRKTAMPREGVRPWP